MATAVAASTRAAMAMSTGTGTMARSSTIASSAANGNMSNNGNSGEADTLLLTNILSTFDEASEEVLRLLSQNSFQRFRASALYRNLITTLQQTGDDDGHSATYNHSMDEQSLPALTAAGNGSSVSPIAGPMATPAFTSSNNNHNNHHRSSLVGPLPSMTIPSPLVNITVAKSSSSPVHHAWINAPPTKSG